MCQSASQHLIPPIHLCHVDMDADGLKLSLLDGVFAFENNAGDHSQDKNGCDERRPCEQEIVRIMLVDIARIAGAVDFIAVANKV